MLTSLVWVVVAVIIAGVLVWVIDQLPAIDPTFKQVARIIIIAVLVIFALLVIAGMFGVGPGLVRWR